MLCRLSVGEPMCSSIFFLFSVVVYFALVRYKNVISILLVSDELDFSLYFVSWFENRFIWSFFSLPLKNHLKRRNKIEQNERKNYAFLEIMMNKFHVIRFPAESFELFLSLQPLIKLTGETKKQPIETWICRYAADIYSPNLINNVYVSRAVEEYEARAFFRLLPVYSPHEMES